MYSIKAPRHRSSTIVVVCDRCIVCEWVCRSTHVMFSARHSVCYGFRERYSRSHTPHAIETITSTLIQFESTMKWITKTYTIFRFSSTVNPIHLHSHSQTEYQVEVHCGDDLDLSKSANYIVYTHSIHTVGMFASPAALKWRRNQLKRVLNQYRFSELLLSSLMSALWLMSLIYVTCICVPVSVQHFR